MAALLTLAALSSVFGVMCLVAGIRGLTETRPMVFNFRWIAWVYIALIVIGIGFSFPETQRMPPAVGFRAWALLAIIVVVVLLGLGWLRDGDFTVIGARQEDFQRAFHAALDAQDLAYEHTPEGTRLASPEATIRVVRFLDSAGSFQLSIRPRRCLPCLKAVAAAMNERFAAHPGQPELLAFRLLTGAGGMGVVMALMLLAGALVG